MNDLAYGAFILVIGVPLLLFYLIIIPEGIMLDINEGLDLIFQFRIIKGLFIFTRPVWSIIVLTFLFWALGNPEKIVASIKGKIFKS